MIGRLCCLFSDDACCAVHSTNGSVSGRSGACRRYLGFDLLRRAAIPEHQRKGALPPRLALTRGVPLIHVFLCAFWGVEGDFPPMFTTRDFPFALIGFGEPFIVSDWGLPPSKAPPSTPGDCDFFVLAGVAWSWAPFEFLAFLSFGGFLTAFNATCCYRMGRAAVRLRRCGRKSPLPMQSQAATPSQTVNFDPNLPGILQQQAEATAKLSKQMIKTCHASTE